MDLKRAFTGIGLIAGTIVAFCANPAQAYTFSTSNATAASVIDFTRLGYRYDTMPNSGNTSGPLQVRRNAATMTRTEIDRFVNAVVALKTQRFVTTPNGVRISEYDQFVATHLATMDMTGRLAPNGTTLVNGAHGNAAFLPWHRQFLDEFERALQTVDSSVTLPYWDWTNQTATRNIIFQNNFMGPNGGAGGVGGGTVQSGPFSRANGWLLRRDLSNTTNRGAWTGLSTGTPRELTRSLRDWTTLGTQTQVNGALAQTSYNAFRSRIETGTGLHNSMHNWIGGSMNLQNSPNDPMFFLVHANVDRLWGQWQLNGRWGNSFYPSSGQPYGHNLLDPMFPWNTGNIPIANDLRDLMPGLPGVTATATPTDSSLFMMASAPSDLSDNTIEHSQTGYMYNPWGHMAYHGDGTEPCPDEIAMPCDMPCHQSEHVPEPSVAFGLLAFGALGAGSQFKRKRKALVKANS
ncbi:tyrosinase family protein [Microcoleus sp. FACHB-672]|uniref:tyrosinase family protein n=1 Tax=Microcoleus sp. FACHB-672 TaxID=2692825 RepID=UPI0016884B43|nr:tyrosinase family protein [Microcoleus sp. FACHB-672]MBD2041918.1 tyrosinase family protein [Microcoleus sp. FACHB-672]